jgi:hypothetical protein
VTSHKQQTGETKVRDIFKSIAYAEQVATRGLDDKAAPPREKRGKPKPFGNSIRAWRAPTTAIDIQYPEQAFRPRKDKPMTQSQLTVTARSIKVTIPLDAAAIAALPVPDGQTRSKLTITCDGKNYIADLATKSLRKSKATIAASGAENTFVMIQGKLRNNEIVEAGLVAQVKAAKTADGSQAA